MEIKGKIVVVDDEKLLTDSLSMLFMVEGIDNAMFFNDPHTALNYLKENEPDIIISDFMMPTMNGIDFLKEVKKQYKDVCTILLTGYSDKENAIKAINEIGIYKYILKPWDNEDLLLNIKNGIERSNLIKKLEEKIEQLEIAQNELKKYSTSLEDIVRERTCELQIINKKLSAIIACCADGIITLNDKGKILSLNPACENIFSQAKEFLINTNIFKILTSEKEDLSNNYFKDNEEVLIRDLYFTNPLTATKTPIEMSIAPIIYDEEKTNYVAVIRDVTMQKDMERLRNDFIATLTHDLRTPLLAAIQTLGFFLDGSLGEIDTQQQRFLETMKRSNEDMLGLVNALLEVYKYEAGQINLCKTEFVIDLLINDCIEKVNSLAEAKNINILTEYKTIENVEIEADKKELRRVIINLLGNAITHTPKDGNINIVIKSDKKDLYVSVSDTGEGIQKTDIAKIFNRFTQGMATKRSVGTGLGLYLSRQIIEAHGGKIWLDSVWGKGSTFSFYIKDCIKNISRV